MLYVVLYICRNTPSHMLCIRKIPFLQHNAASPYSSDPENVKENVTLHPVWLYRQRIRNNNAPPTAFIK